MQASPCLLCCEAFHYGHIRSYSSPLSRSLGDLFFTDFWYLFKEKCLKFSHIRYFQKLYRQNPQRRISREKDKTYNSGLPPSPHLGPSLVKSSRVLLTPSLTEFFCAKNLADSGGKSTPPNGF